MNGSRASVRHRACRRAPSGRRHLVICGLLLAAGAVMLVALALDAPFVSILLVGLVLVCPLLMWAPFRVQQASLRSLDRTDRKGST